MRCASEVQFNMGFTVIETLLSHYCAQKLEDRVDRAARTTNNRIYERLCTLHGWHSDLHDATSDRSCRATDYLEAHNAHDYRDPTSIVWPTTIRALERLLDDEIALYSAALAS